MAQNPFPAFEELAELDNTGNTNFLAQIDKALKDAEKPPIITPVTEAVAQISGIQKSSPLEKPENDLPDDEETVNIFGQQQDSSGGGFNFSSIMDVFNLFSSGGSGSGGGTLGGGQGINPEGGFGSSGSGILVDPSGGGGSGFDFGGSGAVMAYILAGSLLQAGQDSFVKTGSTEDKLLEGFLTPNLSQGIFDGRPLAHIPGIGPFISKDKKKGTKSDGAKLLNFFNFNPF